LPLRAGAARRSWSNFGKFTGRGPLSMPWPNASPVQGGWQSALTLEQARQPTWRSWARDAAIEKKDPLKARGYSWTAGKFERPKCWYRDVSDPDEAAEAAWLRTNAMGPGQPEWALRITAKGR